MQLSDQATLAWVTKGGKGYVAMDEEVKESLAFEAAEEGFEVYMKALLAPSVVPAVAPAAAAAPAVVPEEAVGGEKEKVKEEEKDN